MRNPERFLTRESQFCSLCFGQGKGWIRVANTADMMQLRVGRTERQALAAYKARRRRAILRHLLQVHQIG